LRPKQDGLDVGRPARARTTARGISSLFIFSILTVRRQLHHNDSWQLLFLARNRAHPLQHCDNNNDDNNDDILRQYLPEDFISSFSTEDIAKLCYWWRKGYIMWLCKRKSYSVFFSKTYSKNGMYLKVISLISIRIFLANKIKGYSLFN